MDFQIEKRLVQEFYKSIEMSTPQNILSVLKKYCSETLIWRGFHPFNMIRGPEEVGKKFWQPLLKSLKKCQRREDIFFAGFNEIKGHEGVWVVSMGHLMGLFDESWLGIPASEKLIMLRYCEFNKIEKGKIIETAMFFDIPHLMSQTGINPFVSQTAPPLQHVFLRWMLPKQGQKIISSRHHSVPSQPREDRRGLAAAVVPAQLATGSLPFDADPSTLC